MSKTRDLANLADLNFDSGTMVVDKVNDRVGVGNATPSATLDVDGTIKLDGNYPVGTGNVALGDAALDANTTANNNTAVGNNSLTATTTGVQNVGVGSQALLSNTTGQNNVAIGMNSLFSNTTASNNTALGFQALTATTTGHSNVAMGQLALSSNTTGVQNVAIGTEALSNHTTNNTTAVGHDSLKSNTIGTNNTALGYRALQANTTSANNTAVGSNALDLNTGANNTAVGTDALGANTTGTQNIAVGGNAGDAITSGSYNTVIGYNAAGAMTTGTYNAFLGRSSGSTVTTGSKNTIIGSYNGNQGGLDIRTSNNNIVLSDGDGNPRMYVDSGGGLRMGVGSTAHSNHSSTDGLLQAYDSSGEWGVRVTSTFATQFFANFLASGSSIGSIVGDGSSTAYNTSSDYRLKENVVDLTGASDRVQQLAPKQFNFIAKADTTVDGFLAHEVQSVVPEAITGTKDAVDADGNPVYQGIDQSKLVPLLTAALQEALTKIEQLETRIVALETN